MKQAISGAMADRKGTMKMGVKNQPKNDGTIVAAINHKTTVRLTTRAQLAIPPIIQLAIPANLLSHPPCLVIHENGPA
jgi:hypothetical protein